jgi:hypothetical protein
MCVLSRCHVPYGARERNSVLKNSLLGADPCSGESRRISINKNKTKKKIMIIIIIIIIMNKYENNNTKTAARVRGVRRQFVPGPAFSRLTASHQFSETPEGPCATVLETSNYRYDWCTPRIHTHTYIFKHRSNAIGWVSFCSFIYWYAGT